MRSKYVRFSAEWWAWMTEPEPNSGCLLWLGSVCKFGHGRVARSGGGSPVLVHRIAYEQVHGPIGSKHVCHRCDTPSCVNVDHLFVGSQKDNMRDMFAKGRGRPGGRVPRRRETPVAAAVAVRELALVNSNASVATKDIVHLTRTSAMVAPWRQVTGVPSHRPTRALVVWQRPLSWTAEPANSADAGYQAAATVAPGCLRSPFHAPTSRGTER